MMKRGSTAMTACPAAWQPARKSMPVLSRKRLTDRGTSHHTALVWKRMSGRLSSQVSKISPERFQILLKAQAESTTSALPRCMKEGEGTEMGERAGRAWPVRALADRMPVEREEEAEERGRREE